MFFFEGGILINSLESKKQIKELFLPLFGDNDQLQSFCIGGPQTGDLDYCLRVTRDSLKLTLIKQKRDFEFHFDSGHYLIDNVVKAQANPTEFFKKLQAIVLNVSKKKAFIFKEVLTGSNL